MPIDQPLDPAATSAADDRFYARYPSMVNPDGSRIPLSAQNDPNNDMHETWCRFYEEELARERGEAPEEDEDEEDEAPEEEEDDEDSDIPGGEHPTDGPCEDCPEDDPDAPTEEDEPVVSIRGCVFFDGTGNNKENVNTGGTRDASYKAGHSNVSKLSDLYLNDTEADEGLDPIYIEGIGTVTGGNDSKYGGATGDGETGIPTRVNMGIDALVSAILAASAGKKISWIKIDTFGFSRGAAASRHFIWRILRDTGNTLRDRLSGREVGDISVKFVGLFDTVASFGARHYNDTRELGLDAIADAERVVQLAAAEEHRMNFRLTNISSAGNGSQYFLPGVHSDIGGGYTEDGRSDASDDEVDLQLADLDNPFSATLPLTLPSYLAMEAIIHGVLNSEWNWMTERDWYTDDELEISSSNELKGTRRGMSNTYNRIPLRIMARKATDWGVMFSGDLTAHSKYRIPPGDAVLQAAKTQIDAGLGNGNSSGPSYYLNNTATWHKNLRRRHLHFSSWYGVIYGDFLDPASWNAPTANWPQYKGGMTHPLLEPIRDRLLGGDKYFGHRERVIQNG